MPIARQSKKSARCFQRALRTRTRRGKNKVPVKFGVSAISKAPVWHTDLQGAMFCPTEAPHVVILEYLIARSK